MPDSSIPNNPPRHDVVVRVTHWINALCFLALLVSGVEILISHPRFYWGETGNVMTPSLFEIPIPASRAAVKTGYGFVLPDQNGWSRALHFQAAWIAALGGLVYALFGVFSGHFRRNLLGTASYDTSQRFAYMAVIFGLFPLIIWTGLAMSPGFTAMFPFTVNLLGGHQSARTIHFFAFVTLVLFFVGHVVMVWLTGFRNLMKEMITG